jgi:hypothetical protein
MVRRFIGHLVCRQSAELLINERKQFIGGLRIAVFDGLEDMGDVTHADAGSQEIPGDVRKPKDEVFQRI